MEKLLENLNLELSELIKKISSLAKEYGYKVYLVGGFVRDILLGRQNFDVDIVVEGKGVDFSLELAKLLHAKAIIHKEFGTAAITYALDKKIDVATARKEVYLKPAALPKVTVGSIDDDLRRRDFTINALAVSLNKDSYGKIIDLFNGLNDLKNGYVRVLHKESFIDDPTRIIRGVRFQQRFGFDFSKDTYRLISQARKLKMLQAVQRHRLRDELILMLKEENPPKVIEKLFLIYGLNFLQRKIRFDRPTKLLVNKCHNEISWFKNTFPNKRRLDGWLIYLMILVRNLTPNEINGFCHDFAFKKGEVKRILSYNEKIKYLKTLLNKDVIKPSVIYHILEPFSYETIIAVLATIKNPRILRHIHNFFASYSGIRLSINGHDLKMLGAKPGPHFKTILKKALQAKLDREISHKHEELSFVKKHLNIKNS